MIQIINAGAEQISLIDDDDMHTHDLACVLNFKSKKKFFYYLSEVPIENIIQHAVTNARKDVSHILFLASGVVLNDYEYTFDTEKKSGMFTDGDSWATRKMALIKVTPAARVDIHSITDILCVKKFDENIIDCNPNVKTMHANLLKMEDDVNFKIAEIRAFYTLIPTPPPPPVPRLFIATPSLDMSVSVDYTKSLILTIELLKKNGIHTEIQLLPCKTIAQGRNHLTNIFLKNSCSHMMFIDPDIKWNPKDIIVLLNNKKKLSVGLCPISEYNNIKTSIDFKKIVYDAQFLETNIGENVELLEIKHSHCNFALIDKSVFTSLRGFASEYNDCNIIMNDYFSCKTINGVYFPEDGAFCELWRSVGGECWTDLRICLQRQGHHTYNGDPFKSFTP